MNINEKSQIKNPYFGLSEKERFKRCNKEKINLKEVGFFFKKDFELPEKMKIMVIEQSELLRKSYIKISDTFDKDKVEMEIIEDGMEAIKKYQNKSKYDLIILPLQMPIYGVDCALKFRNLGFKGILILYSASYYKHALRAMINGKMDGYINKMMIGFHNIIDLIRINKK